jgi:AcrR family transcriptional regulator
MLSVRGKIVCMTVTRTPAANVRGLLVAAALKVLDESGEKGLTVRAVAAEAGVAPMGVYNHFEGKTGLMTALVTEGFARLRSEIGGVVDTDSHIRLRRAGVAYRAFALRSPMLYRVMFSGLSKPEGDIAAAALGSLTEIVRYCQAAGTIRSGEPFDLTLQIWACVHGAVSLELDGSGPPGGEAHWEFIYQQTLDLISRGIAP